MGAAAESLTLEKDTPTRSAEAGVQQTAPASSAFDPFVQRLFGSAPSDPPAAVADSLSMQRFRAPVLQRAQRLYGNRASQQIVQRSHTIQRQCACGGTCAKCQEEEQQRQVQRSSASTAPAEFDGIPASTGGEQLDPATRRPMEAHFGADLADVRVHTGSEAAKSATSLDALAYTTGRDIYFASGMYAPSSDSGRRLLAHEVAHVVQQSSGKEPTLATKSSHGAKIGAPDDPLETEADRAAEEFMTGPLTEDERKKREAGSAVQRFIQRQPLLTSPTPGNCVQRQQTPGGEAPAAGQAPPVPLPPTAAPEPTRPKSGAAEEWFQGVHLARDPDWLRVEMRSLIGRHGLKGMDMWFGAFTGARPTIDLPFSAHARAFGGLRPRTAYDIKDEMPDEEKAQLLKSLTPMVYDAYVQVRAEAVKFLQDFEDAAKKNVGRVLDAQENQANAEGLRYGITSEQIKKIRYSRGGKTTELVTVHHMGADSPAAKGLQAAVKVLLGRQQKIERLRQDQSRHLKLQRDPTDPKGSILVPDEHYAAIGKQIDDDKAGYETLRSVLSAEFPALAAFSELDKGMEGLETLAAKGGGPDTATLVGEKIDEVLRNIDKTRNGINTGEINVWRLAKFVETTSLQFEDTMMKRKLVEDKREAEQPGVWQDIALLALNIGALVLAAPTGGASLAAAAVVNAGVAAVHIQEYLTKEAMSGTAFDKAQAISQEDPSLFWLAVEIVGVVADVGAAAGALAKTFKTLQPLVKTAQTAAEGEAANKALEAVQTAAKAEKGEGFASRIVARLKSLRKGSGSTVLEAAGATEEEVKALQKVAKAAESEAVGGIGKAVSSVGGEVNVSKSGRLWSCRSPCELFREKYASVFAQSDETSKGLLRELEALETQAAKAAKARQTAEVGKDAGEIAKAEALADKVKQDAAALEGRLQAENTGIIEEATAQGPAIVPRPPRPPATGRGGAAREIFSDLRPGYAQRLGVPPGGQVHHAIELQVLDRYPGAFTEAELNGFGNMRGITTEEAARQQLHGSKVRELWDRHYVKLNGEIQARNLVPNTTEYRDFVRQYLTEAKNEIDHVLGQFFSEYRIAMGLPR
jgi:hypothetical protein